jgi:hypothetical protein
MANILPWVLSKFMACDSTEASNLLTT